MSGWQEYQKSTMATMRAVILVFSLSRAASSFSIGSHIISPQRATRSSTASTTGLYLQPVEDPNAKLSTKSLAGVLYEDVLQGLYRLYPPSDYADRNAVSRAGGYWPYIKEGEEPPLELTYGEFDLPFFAEILDAAHRFFDTDENDAGTWAGKTFCDIGSGTGRLVVSAAALHPNLALSRGVEYVENCHDLAVKMVWKCRKGLAVTDERTLPLAPIDLTCGSIGDPATFIGDVDVAFISSSAMPAEVLEMISRAVGKQCKVGTVVVSTDYEIPTEGVVDGMAYRLELLDTMDGYCWIVGGTSTAYFYRLVESCSSPAPPPLPVVPDPTPLPDQLLF